MRGRGGPSYPILLRVASGSSRLRCARWRRHRRSSSTARPAGRAPASTCLHCSQRRYREPEFPEVDGEHGLRTSPAGQEAARGTDDQRRLGRAGFRATSSALVGNVFMRDGALHNGVALLDEAGSPPPASSTGCPGPGTFDETAPLRPRPAPGRSSSAAPMLRGLPICEDIWHPEGLPSTWPISARACSSASMAAPTRSTNWLPHRRA